MYVQLFKGMIKFVLHLGVIGWHGGNAMITCGGIFPFSCVRHGSQNNCLKTSQADHCSIQVPFRGWGMKHSVECHTVCAGNVKNVYPLPLKSSNMFTLTRGKEMIDMHLRTSYPGLPPNCFSCSRGLRGLGMRFHNECYVHVLTDLMNDIRCSYHH